MIIRMQACVHTVCDWLKSKAHLIVWRQKCHSPLGKNIQHMLLTHNLEQTDVNWCPHQKCISEPVNMWLLRLIRSYCSFVCAFVECISPVAKHSMDSKSIAVINDTLLCLCVCACMSARCLQRTDYGCNNPSDYWERIETRIEQHNKHTLLFPQCILMSCCELIRLIHATVRK